MRVCVAGRVVHVDGHCVNLNGMRVRMVDPEQNLTEPELEQLAYQLDRLPRMLRQARLDKDALAINWLETLERAVTYT